MEVVALGPKLVRRARSALRYLVEFVPRRPRPAILTYHRVADETFDPWALSVSPANFQDQLDWIAANRTVLRLEEFVDRHLRGILPDDAIAVTFDDGYACNLEVAKPLLDRRGIPATIFLPAALIEKQQPFWWDELEELVLGYDEPSLTLVGEAFPLGPKQPDDRSWRSGAEAKTPRQRAFEAIHSRLAEMPPGQREKGLQSIRRQAGRRRKGLGDKRTATADELRAAAGGLVEYGSHSLSHPWLTSLSEDGQRHEICDSVEKCRILTGVRPTTFAYPFGTFDGRSEQLAEEAGYICACATKDRAVSARSRRFALPRVAVGDWNSAGLKRRLASVRAE